jgi:hypothetical protein
MEGTHFNFRQPNQKHAKPKTKHKLLKTISIFTQNQPNPKHGKNSKPNQD